MWRMTALQVAELNKPDPAAKKTAVITGASSGIGLATAVALAQTGWRVICAVRNVEKMQKEMGKVGSVSPGSMEPMELDLCSFESVKKFADALLKREDFTRLDALILNAGLAGSWGLTKDGYELNFQTCHLSHHLLARLLENKLIESAPSRIVIVSSTGHRMAGKYDWPSDGHKGFHSDSSSGFGMLAQYSRCKLANMHLALILGKRLKEKGVSVNTLHPGAVNSNIWPWWMVGRWLFMLTNEQGAAVTTMLATDPRFDAKDYPLLTYWVPSFYGLPHQEEPSQAAKDETVAQRLWDVTESIVGSYL